MHTVRDLVAPGAGFIRNEMFCVYGPGPFGSGSRVYLERNVCVYGPG